MKRLKKIAKKIKRQAKNFLRMNEAIRMNEKSSSLISRSKKKIIDEIIVGKK